MNNNVSAFVILPPVKFLMTGIFSSLLPVFLVRVHQRFSSADIFSPLISKQAVMIELLNSSMLLMPKSET